jgi:ribosomal protein S18 acetylase RimI-like enzyme
VASEPIVVRPVRSESDLAAIAQVDTSFSTDTIYRVAREALAFRLVPQQLEQPLVKVYSWSDLTMHDGLMVACVRDEVVGAAEVLFEKWNSRARIEHLYVSSPHRGQGGGRALVQAIDARARAEPGIRCLWLETQNVNFPAVQFYLRAGFRLCGLDETLYRPGDPGVLPGEVALYFARDVAPTAAV